MCIRGKAYGPLVDEKHNYTFNISVVRLSKKGVVAQIEGISSRTELEKFYGLDLYVNRSVLPKLKDEEFYHSDLVGLLVNDIGGKTGTAQNAGDKNNTSWFVGIDSVTNPKYLVVTVVDEGGSGSAVAAPVSRRIIQHLLGYDITPVEFGEITE